MERCRAVPLGGTRVHLRVYTVHVEERASPRVHLRVYT